MTYYGKMQGLMTLSESADYNRGESWGPTFEWSPVEFMGPLVTPAAVGPDGLTINTTMLSTVHGLLIENLSSTATENVRVDWYSRIGYQAPGVLGFTFTNGVPDTIVDADAAGTFLTNYARVGCYVYVAGTAGDNGTYLVTAAAADALTVNQNATFTGATEIITLRFLCLNSIWIPPNSGYIMVVGPTMAPLWTASNIVLTSAVGTPNCRLSFFN